MTWGAWERQLVCTVQMMTDAKQPSTLLAFSLFLATSTRLGLRVVFSIAVPTPS